jgi:hypothetical protein
MIVRQKAEYTVLRELDNDGPGVVVYSTLLRLPTRESAFYRALLSMLHLPGAFYCLICQSIARRTQQQAFHNKFQIIFPTTKFPLFCTVRGKMESVLG